jgi:hypothetical protein
VLEHQLSGLGVQHLGMPLDAGEAALRVLERRDRGSGAAGERGETGRGGGHRVAVAHPHVEAGRETGQQGATAGDGGQGPPELAQPRPRHVTTEGPGHGLEPVADAERRHVGVEQLGVDLRGPRGVDRLWTAGEDDGPGLPGDDLGHGGGVRHDLGVHVGLADPARDQLGVLRPEVDDDDQVVLVLAHEATRPFTG